MDSANFSTFRRYVVDREVDKAADIAVDNWTWRLTRWPAWWWTVDTLLYMCSVALRIKELLIIILTHVLQFPWVRPNLSCNISFNIFISKTLFELP